MKSYLNNVIRDLFEVINFDHLSTILNEHQIKINEYRLKNIYMETTLQVDFTPAPNINCILGLGIINHFLYKVSIIIEIRAHY